MAQKKFMGIIMGSNIRFPMEVGKEIKTKENKFCMNYDMNLVCDTLVRLSFWGGILPSKSFCI